MISLALADKAATVGGVTREEIDRFESHTVADLCQLGYEVNCNAKETSATERQIARTRAFCDWARTVLDAANGTSQRWEHFQLECDKSSFAEIGTA